MKKSKLILAMCTIMLCVIPAEDGIRQRRSQSNCQRNAVCNDNNIWNAGSLHLGG